MLSGREVSHLRRSRMWGLLPSPCGCTNFVARLWSCVPGRRAGHPRESWWDWARLMPATPVVSWFVPLGGWGRVWFNGASDGAVYAYWIVAHTSLFVLGFCR